MSFISLNELKIGQKGSIKELTGPTEICQRLLEMGLTQGTLLEVVRFAPLGDPIDVKLRGYHLSLRRQEAKCIIILPKE